MGDREIVDALIAGVDLEAEYEIPLQLKSKLEKWKWGKTGWISPASLIITAAWRKHLHPEVDCCCIWAQDERSRPIPGGYSIRSEDETVTVPLFAKYDLCKGFCSANSGMQGSRAIEKMRGMKRLNRDFGSVQRTLFDLKLFAGILNDINDLDSAGAKEAFLYLVQLAMRIRNERVGIDEEISNLAVDGFDPWRFLSTTADPELTKCFVAACLEATNSAYGMIVEGVSDHRTAADARAGKPGDLALIKNGECVAAIEVKDKTQHIDWQNINRAKDVISGQSSIQYFLIVLEDSAATADENVREILSSERMQKAPENLIVVSPLYLLYRQALAVVNKDQLARRIGELMALAPDVKTETKELWVAAVLAT